MTSLSISPLLLSKVNFFRQFCQIVSLSYNLMVAPSNHSPPFRAYVAKGNNSHLVRSILRSRFWWVVDEQVQPGMHYQLVWTQLRDNNALEQFRKEKHDDFQGINFLVSQQEEDENKERRRQSLSQTVIFKRDEKVYKEEDKIVRDEEKKPSKTFISSRAQCVSINLRKILSNLNINELRSLKLLTDTYNLSSLRRNKCHWHRNPQDLRSHNHMECNYHLSNKKALFMNLRSHYEAQNQDPFKNIPMTFHIEKIRDAEYIRWREYFLACGAKQKGKKKRSRNIWVVKPGQNSNRGYGIIVTESLQQINSVLQNDHTDERGRPRSHIIQEYIMPFLYNKRKFDIRCYILLSTMNGMLKGYWYQEGYIRTTSKEFTLKNLSNKYIHLTNDAIQKKSQDYGKYQTGNKITFFQFQRYLDSQGQKISFWVRAYPEMKRLATQAIRSVYGKIDPNRKGSFEIFGLDFMIDQQFKVFLIEANTNPCLDTSSPILSKIIPSLLDNAFRLTLDPQFPMPPPSQFPLRKPTLPQNMFESNKFELIFDQSEEYKELGKLATVQIFDIEEEEEQVYQ